MSKENYIEKCLRSRVLFFTGKGGVGKTTLAWATALACQRRGRPTIVCTWNPFDRESLSARLLDHAENIWKIQWINIEPLSAFREYVLLRLKFDTIYDAVFDHYIFRTFLKAAPGFAETVVAGKIWDTYERHSDCLIIADLPSTGHAVSFFQSPLGIRQIFSVGFVHREANKIIKMFLRRSTSVHIVAMPEELPIEEAAHLKEKLHQTLPLEISHLHINRCTPTFGLSQSASLNAPDADKCLQQHFSQLKQEQHVIETARTIGLPLIQTPTFVSAEGPDLIAAVASHLEQS
ncbi:MAG: hypothetical protein HY537_09300 [Deltaproteobacteria bacterium]|nr:hypothetical protein [Deltaproteobacteria bacterium]